MTTAPKLREQLLADVLTRLDAIQRERNSSADQAICDAGNLIRSLAAEPVGGDEWLTQALNDPENQPSQWGTIPLSTLPARKDTATEYGFPCDSDSWYEHGQDVGWNMCLDAIASPKQPDSAEGVVSTLRETNAVVSNETHIHETQDEQPKAEGDYLLTVRRFADDGMMAAGVEAARSAPLDAEDRPGYRLVRAVYDAMLSVAPQPESIDPGLWDWLGQRNLQPDAHNGIVSMDDVVTALTDYEAALTQPELHSAAAESLARDGVEEPFAYICNGRVFYDLERAKEYQQPKRFMPDNQIIACYHAQQADASARALADELASDGLEHYAERAMSLSSGVLRPPVKRMAEMLENGEWAEHVSDDPDIQRLEVQITSLIPQQADGGAVARVRFADGDMDIEQLAPMVDGLLYQHPPKSPGVDDEMVDRFWDAYIDNGNGSQILNFRDVKPLLLAALGGEK